MSSFSILFFATLVAGTLALGCGGGPGDASLPEMTGPPSLAPSSGRVLRGTSLTFAAPVTPNTSSVFAIGSIYDDDPPPNGGIYNLNAQTSASFPIVIPAKDAFGGPAIVGRFYLDTIILETAADSDGWTRRSTYTGGPNGGFFSVDQCPHYKSTSTSGGAGSQCNGGTTGPTNIPVPPAVALTNCIDCSTYHLLFQSMSDNVWPPSVAVLDPTMQTVASLIAASGEADKLFSITMDLSSGKYLVMATVDTNVANLTAPVAYAIEIGDADTQTVPFMAIPDPDSYEPDSDPMMAKPMTINEPQNRTISITANSKPDPDWMSIVVP